MKRRNNDYELMEDFEKEDEEMMIRLIKVRGHMWT